MSNRAKNPEASAGRAAKPAAGPRGAAKKIAAAPAIAPKAAPGATLEQILAELAAVRAAVEKALPRPIPADAALDGTADAVRRILSELMEARLQSVLGRVVAIRGLCAPSGVGAPALSAIDQLIADLGGMRFDATRLDYADPLIHKVAGERHEAGAPDGVVLQTLQPGYRTAQGAVLAKAAVVVNRRD